MRTFLKSLFLCAMFFLCACGGKLNQSSGNINSSCRIVEKEKYTRDGFQWALVKYSDGTYGAEIGNNIILKDCENKIYIEGYDNDYAFKTQKGDDWHFYNMSGTHLFTIPNMEHVNVVLYISDGKANVFKNGYLLVEDFDDRCGVYSLDGKKVIEPKYNWISSVDVRIGNSWVIFGYKCDNPSGESDIYDYNGNLILSEKDVIQESKGVCPVFRVDESDTYMLYNYKGRRIVDTDYYTDYSVEVNDDGFSYIVCETENARENYYERDRQLWVSINGRVLKEEGTTWTDGDVLSDEKNEFRKVKNLLLGHMEKLPRFNKKSTGCSNTATGNPAEPYSPIIDNGGVPNIDNGTGNTGASADDNSYKERYYTDTYRRYERLVESHISTLNTLNATADGGATSNYAISDTKSKIRDAKNNMKRVRNEALQKGIIINPSYLEN